MPIGFQARLHLFVFAMCLSAIALADYRAGYEYAAIFTAMLAICLKLVVIAAGVRAIVRLLRGLAEE